VAKTMLPIINQSVRDDRAKLHIVHQGIRTYYSDATTAATTTAATTTTTTPATATATSAARSSARFLGVPQRFQRVQTGSSRFTQRYACYFLVAVASLRIHRIENNKHVQELTTFSTGRGVELLVAGLNHTFPN
jgi:hypothetical protein